MEKLSVMQKELILSQEDGDKQDTIANMLNNPAQTKRDIQL